MTIYTIKTKYYLQTSFMNEIVYKWIILIHRRVECVIHCNRVQRLLKESCAACIYGSPLPWNEECNERCNDDSCNNDPNDHCLVCFPSFSNVLIAWHKECFWWGEVMWITEFTRICELTWRCEVIRWFKLVWFSKWSRLWEKVRFTEFFRGCETFWVTESLWWSEVIRFATQAWMAELIRLTENKIEIWILIHLNLWCCISGNKKRSWWILVQNFNLTTASYHICVI